MPLVRQTRDAIVTLCGLCTCVTATGLFVVAMTSMLATIGASASQQSLFTMDPGTVDLETVAFRQLHASAHQCPWVLMFYNSGCGHCRAFQPTFSQLAKNFDAEDSVVFGAINCPNHPKPCMELKIMGVPQIVIALPKSRGASLDALPPLAADAAVDPTMEYVMLKDRKNLAKDIREKLAGLGLSPQEAQRCGVLKASLLAKKRRLVGHGGYDVVDDTFVAERDLFQQDVAGAFYSTMRDEVPMGARSPAAAVALTEFLRHVDAALPALHAGALAAKMDTITGIKDPTEWRRDAERVGIPVVLKDSEPVWRTCKGSAWRYRGIPCGMWTLYHSLLANAPAGQAKSMLDSIRGYVHYYFACQDCKQHFEGMAYRLKESASDDEALLWLWQAHNQVNARLAKDGGSSDPKVPKIPWPSSEACPRCWHRKAQHATEAAVGSDPTEAFDLVEVTAFLRSHYKWATMHAPVLGAVHSVANALSQAQSPVSQANNENMYGEAGTLAPRPTLMPLSVLPSTTSFPIDMAHAQWKSSRDTSNNRSIAVVAAIALIVFVLTAGVVIQRRSSRARVAQRRRRNSPSARV